MLLIQVNVLKKYLLAMSRSPFFHISYGRKVSKHFATRVTDNPLLIGILSEILDILVAHHMIDHVTRGATLQIGIVGPVLQLGWINHTVFLDTISTLGGAPSLVSAYLFPKFQFTGLLI